MRRRAAPLRRIIAAVAAVFGGLALAAAAPDERACAPLEFEGAPFTVCRFDPARHELRLVWRGADGRPLLRLDALERSLGDEARRVRFAMNAGMYEPDHSPVGLHVENGAEVRPLNTAEGAGNFYLKPNGVFLVDRAGRAQVLTAEAYAARSSGPRWASQSGPMLVIAGELHPRIQPDGASRLIRNGVGACGQGAAVFAISDAPVSFGRFARLFRDRLACPDALYLDGSVSSLWAPELGRQDVGRALGPMVVVLDRR